MLRYHNPRVGGSRPSSTTKNFNEIDQIYQSHLIMVDLEYALSCAIAKVCVTIV